jgi:hypothetical protein
VKGSIQLLVAGGFGLELKPHVEVSSSTDFSKEKKGDENADVEHQPITTENKHHYIFLLESLSTISVDDNLLTSFSSFLYPATKWELFLEMIEPPIDDLLSISAPSSSSSSSDIIVKEKMTWIQWYDSLKESLETIKGEI